MCRRPRRRCVRRSRHRVRDRDLVAPGRPAVEGADVERIRAGRERERRARHARWVRAAVVPDRDVHAVAARSDLRQGNRATPQSMRASVCVAAPLRTFARASTARHRSLAGRWHGDGVSDAARGDRRRRASEVPSIGGGRLSATSAIRLRSRLGAIGHHRDVSRGDREAVELIRSRCYFTSIVPWFMSMPHAYRIEPALATSMEISTARFNGRSRSMRRPSGSTK